MTYHFDGSTYTIAITTNWKAIEVTVTEGDYSITLVSHDGNDLAKNGRINADAMMRAGLDKWTADRIAYCFHLAQRRIDLEAMAA